jgi:hypothetical protein
MKKGEREGRRKIMRDKEREQNSDFVRSKQEMVGEKLGVRMYSTLRLRGGSMSWVE